MTGTWEPRPARESEGPRRADPAQPRYGRGRAPEGGGAPLDAAIRADMERRFAHDFSGVRLHTDHGANAATARLGAAAFTVGPHISFAGGQPAPASVAGRWLLAHELAHVVQQEGRSASATRPAVRPPGDAWERRADRAADAAAVGGAVPQPGRGLGLAVQRQPAVGAAPPHGNLFATLGLPGLPLAAEDIETGEAISKDNPKMVELARHAGSSGLGPRRRVTLSAYLSRASESSSAAEQSERARLVGRMQQVRDVLVSLGAAADIIDVMPPFGHATSAHGEVSARVAEPNEPALRQPPPGGGTPLPPVVTPLPATRGKSLSDMLTVKVGPLTVSLPNSVKAKLPIALTSGLTLEINLSADVPGKFAFALTLDGKSIVKVSLGVGVEYDTDRKSVIGLAGLKIEFGGMVCRAPDPGETRAKITEAGTKLMKAAQEYGAATDPEDKVSKLIAISGAIYDMYDAVDKAQSKCTKVPRATFEFGGHMGLSPGTETDRTRLAPYVGPSITLRF